MNKQCPHCGVTFEIEPGFFQGAMYVSYGFSVIIFVITGVFTSLVFENPSVSTYMWMVIMVVLLAFPHMYRMSRTIYLYLFSGIKFEDELSVK